MSQGGFHLSLTSLRSSPGSSTESDFAVVVQSPSLCVILRPCGLKHIRILYPLLSPKFECAHIHVHWVGDTIQQILPSAPRFSSCLHSFRASGSFPVSRFFASGGQSIGALATVLPMNIQGWFILPYASHYIKKKKPLRRPNLFLKKLKNNILNSSLGKNNFFCRIQHSSHPACTYWHCAKLDCSYMKINIQIRNEIFR